MAARLASRAPGEALVLGAHNRSWCAAADLAASTKAALSQPLPFLVGARLCFSAVRIVPWAHPGRRAR